MIYNIKGKNKKLENIKLLYVLDTLYVSIVEYPCDRYLILTNHQLDIPQFAWDYYQKLQDLLNYRKPITLKVDEYKFY